LHCMSPKLADFVAKVVFNRGFKNSKGRRRGFRVKMRGTSSPHAKRTGDFGKANEAMRIGDYFPPRVFAKNWSPYNFGLLQQYRHDSDVRDVCSNVGYWSISGLVMRTLSSSVFDPKLSFSVDKVVDALRVAHRSGARPKPDIGDMCVGAIRMGEDVDRGSVCSDQHKQRHPRGPPMNRQDREPRQVAEVKRAGPMNG
jgi:hypothetical protein